MKEPWEKVRHGHSWRMLRITSEAVKDNPDIVDVCKQSVLETLQEELAYGECKRRLLAFWYQKNLDDYYERLETGDMDVEYPPADYHRWCNEYWFDVRCPIYVDVDYDWALGSPGDIFVKGGMRYIAVPKRHASKKLLEMVKNLKFDTTGMCVSCL